MYLYLQKLETVSRPSGHSGEIAVHFGGWTAQDEVANGSLRYLNVLEGAHDVNLGIGQHDPRLRHVFDGVFGAAVLARQPADRSGQVVSFQRLDVLNVERIEEKVVQSEQSQGILNFEAHDKGLDEVCGLLNVGNVLRLLPCPDLDIARFEVESDLQFQVFDHRSEDLHPVLF